MPADCAKTVTDASETSAAARLTHDVRLPEEGGFICVSRRFDSVSYLLIRGRGCTKFDRDCTRSGLTRAKYGWGQSEHRNGAPYRPPGGARRNCAWLQAFLRAVSLLHFKAGAIVLMGYFFVFKSTWSHRFQNCYRECPNCCGLRALARTAPVKPGDGLHGRLGWDLRLRIT
jgi:hypothetical protein